MSDTPQGPGWWQASDDKWYPPESHPGGSRGIRRSTTGPSTARPGWLLAVIGLAIVAVLFVGALVLSRGGGSSGDDPGIGPPGGINIEQTDGACWDDHYTGDPDC